MIHPSDTGRTDGTAIAYTHYSIYAVARKNGCLGPAPCLQNQNMRSIPRACKLQQGFTAKKQLVGHASLTVLSLSVCCKLWEWTAYFDFASIGPARNNHFIMLLSCMTCCIYNCENSVQNRSQEGSGGSRDPQEKSWLRACSPCTPQLNTPKVKL